MPTEISLGLGEYLMFYAIAAVIIIAIIGWFFGAALGGAILFAVIAVIVLLVLYAILIRGYRFLLHGSISGGKGGGQ